MARSITLTQPVTASTTKLDIISRAFGFMLRLAADLNRYMDAAHKVHAVDSGTGQPDRQR